MIHKRNNVLHLQIITSQLTVIIGYDSLLFIGSFNIKEVHAIQLD